MKDCKIKDYSKYAEDYSDMSYQKTAKIKPKHSFKKEKSIDAKSDSYKRRKK